MKATPATSPFVSLPDDIVLEILKHSSESTAPKPGTDMKSLGTTCTRLHMQTKGITAAWLADHMPPPPKDGNWRASLEKILSAPKCTEERLFREPMLRRLTKDIRKLEQAGSKHFRDSGFWVTLYKNRESLSRTEITDCLSRMHQFDADTKCQILKALTTKLDKLSAGDRLEALLQIWGTLMEEKPVLRSTQRDAVMEKIRYGGGLDTTTLALLDLKIIFDDLKTRNGRGADISRKLGLLPPEQRWSLLSRYVPDMFRSSIGVACLTGDPVCHKRLIRLLAKRFSDSVDPAEKALVCGHAAWAWKNISTSEAGRALLAMTCKSFVAAPVLLGNASTPSVMGARLHGVQSSWLSQYIDVLIRHFSLVDGYLTKEGCRLLKEKLDTCFKLATEAQLYQHAARLLVKAAAADVTLLPKLKIRSRGAVWAVELALQSLSEIANTDARYALWSAGLKGVAAARDVSPADRQSLRVALTSATGFLPDEVRSKARNKIAAQFEH